MTEEEYDRYEQRTEHRLAMADKVQRLAIGVTCLAGMGIAGEVGYQQFMQISYSGTEADHVVLLTGVALFSLKAIQTVHAYSDYVVRNWRRKNDEFIATGY